MSDERRAFLLEWVVPVDRVHFGFEMKSKRSRLNAIVFMFIRRKTFLMRRRSNDFIQEIIIIVYKIRPTLLYIMIFLVAVISEIRKWYYIEKNSNAHEA